MIKFTISNRNEINDFIVNLFIYFIVFIIKKNYDIS